ASHPLALLRARRERPRGRAADQRDELPASHSRPQGSKPRTASSHSRPGLGTGQGGCELRPIVLGWECRFWVPRQVKRKSSKSANAFQLAPEGGQRRIGRACPLGATSGLMRRNIEEGKKARKEPPLQ